MTLESILVRELRKKKAQEKLTRESQKRFREDNMVLIVQDFNKELIEELEDFDLKIFINETQNNVECGDGDKFYLTASKLHNNIRVGFRVARKGMESLEYMKLFREQMGNTVNASVDREGQTCFSITFMCAQPEVASIIRRVLERVKPKEASIVRKNVAVEFKTNSKDDLDRFLTTMKTPPSEEAMEFYQSLEYA